MPRLLSHAAVGCILLLLAGGGAARAQQSAPASAYDLYGRGPYRAGIPQPSAVLGYELGATHTTFRDQERVIAAVAEAAKDRVRVLDYGKSVEGRPLRLVVVTSAANLARLDAIRADIGRLADPRTLTVPADADALAKSLPVLTWINHCIHGDETASFEAVMWTLYTLAASDAPEVREALDRSVVVLNPVYNPDGHERFVVYYNSVALGSPESGAFEKSIPWAVRGRFNHYRFDMNRDLLAQSQPETRQATAAFLQWHPQVFVDEHGQPQTYFFPPNSLPTNRAADRDRVKKWTGVFGRANAQAFDRNAWGYVNRETYDLFYPGYLDSFTTLSGAIGMTYETDGGGNLARRRDDGTLSTLRDAAVRHVEAALTTVTTTAQNREGLLRDFAAFRRSAIEEGRRDKFRRVVILPGTDPSRLAELASLLTRVGVEVREASAPFESGSAHAYRRPGRGVRRKFPAGSLVIDLAQPQGRLARAFLEPAPDAEPEFVKEQNARRERNEKRNAREPREDYEFYDVTAWGLPYTFGVEACWTEDAPDVPGATLTAGSDGVVHVRGEGGGVAGGARAGVAYLFRYDRDAAGVLALRLLQEGYRVAVVTKPAAVGAEGLPRGTFVVRVGRNAETVHARLAELARSLGVPVTALSSSFAEEKGGGLGSENVASLKRPRIAVAADEGVNATSYGAVWHLLDRAGVRFTAVRLRGLSDADLARYNVLILPDGRGYADALGKTALVDLKEWLRRGGALLGLGGGGTWWTGKDVDLTSARPVAGDPDDDSAPTGKSDKDGKKPGAKGKAPLSLPGAIFSARIDPTHFLGWAYPEGEVPVPLEGDTFLKASTTGSNVVTFGKGPSALSGWVWPGNTEEWLSGTAYVIDEPVGAGHAILYLNDPTYRALWPGLRRLFLSGILFGPMGSPADPFPAE